MIAVLVTMGMAQALAQSTNDTNVITFTTNLEQIINVTLTGFTGGASNATGVATVRIGSKDLIQSISTATSINFSPRAKLVLINPLVEGDTNFVSAVVVRDTLSRTNVDTDVSQFFGVSTIGTPVIKSKASSHGKTSGTAWSIENFVFGSSGADTNVSATTIFLNLQGFTTTVLASGAFNSTVNGPGSINLLDSVLQGKITGAAAKRKALQIP